MIGVTPETAPAIEAHTRELLDALEAHFAEHPYLLGASPSLADCALMGPFYAHLYLDAVPARLLRETAPAHLSLDRAHEPSRSRRVRAAGSRATRWRRRCARCCRWRRATRCRSCSTRCARSRPGPTRRRSRAGELPRAVGMHRTALRGIAFERFTLSYTLWMVQRVLDAVPRARRRASAPRSTRALAGTGCEPLLAYAPRHRVERRPFKLFLSATEE